MTKRFLILLMLCLLFAGCGYEASPSLPNNQAASSALFSDDLGSAGSQSSGETPAAFRDIAFADLDLTEYGIDPMTYEEYFSEERYWQFDTFMWPYDIDMDKNALMKKEDGQFQVYYQHDAKIDQAFCGNQYIVYFLSENTIYRLFIPTCQVDAIYHNDEMRSFKALTNYTIMYFKMRPDYEEPNPDMSIDPPQIPSPQFIYSSLTGEEWQVYHEDFGMHPGVPMISMSPEKIYPLPNDGKISPSN